MLMLNKKTGNIIDVNMDLIPDSMKVDFQECKDPEIPDVLKNSDLDINNKIESSGDIDLIEEDVIKPEKTKKDVKK